MFGNCRGTGHPYRWRTWLRGRLPWFLINLGVAAKGKDCERAGGEHRWYNLDGGRSACYHCRVTRPGRLWAAHMISEAERRFREAERWLDELLRRDEALITGRGVAVADESGRAYHYQNERLSWRHRFEVRRARGSEVEKVWVVASLDEEDASALRVRRRAEVFQVGKPSRWVSTAEESLPLAEAARRGLGSIVLEAISAGEAEAAGAS